MTVLTLCLNSINVSIIKSHLLYYRVRKIGLLLIPFLCLLFVSCSSKETKKTENPGDLYVQGVNLLNKKKYSEAIEKFMKIKEDFPFDPLTIIAQVKLGDAYFAKEEYLLASGVYEDFFNAHPADDNIPYVLRRLGESYTQLSPTIDRDQAFTVKAIERFTYLKNRYPQSAYAKDVDARIDELREKQAAHELYVGEYYHRTERYNASILRLEYLLAKYPQAKNRDKALFLLADCYRKLQSPEKGRFYQEQLKKEYPKSIYATSTMRHAIDAEKPKPKVTKSRETVPVQSVQSEGDEKRQSVTLQDTGSTKKKEIDLRPAAAEQNKTVAEVPPTTQAQAASAPRSDLPAGKALATPTTTVTPDAVRGAGKADQTSASSMVEPPALGSSGIEPGVSEATAEASGPELASKPLNEKKDDQRKSPLGFFSAEKKPIDVVSDSMEGLEKGKVIIFKGNVVAIQGDLQMFSDTLTAYLGEESNEIEKAVASGHVKIVKQDRIATCEEALFENTKGEITLKGNVVVFSGPNKVVGDIVKYFINEDRVSVESEKGKRARVTVHPKQ
ncbi:MAG TPA: lipopolysaccharide transport periplasmic protein LptA [Deltaproteobacteria bacterium]|nr:lipopolysaccharide transport periplasmic protein LptA [Deltaproteobacteria bacterium]